MQAILAIIRLSKKLEGDDFIPIVKDNSYKSLRNGTIQTENILTMEVTHKIPARMRITKFMDTEESTIQKDVNHISGRSAQNLDEIAEKIAFLNQQLTNRLDGLLRSVFGGVTSFLRSRDDILTRN